MFSSVCDCNRHEILLSVLLIVIEKSLECDVDFGFYLEWRSAQLYLASTRKQGVIAIILQSAHVF